MANLKTFSGFSIQNLSSDPVPFAQAKTNDPYAGVWSSGGSKNTGTSAHSSSGIQTASLTVGGEDAPGTTQAIVESYNGSTFTEVADLNTARKFLASAGAGNTANLAFGGGPPTAGRTETESWNGSSWTEVADLNQGRYKIGRAHV